MKDNLEIFYNFIKSNKHLFEKGNKEFSADKIMFQLAYEHTENSSVSKKAEDYFDQGRVNWPCIKQINRRKSVSNKLFDLAAYEYTDLLGYYKGRREVYFPIQNFPKILPSKSLVVTSPVILPK